MATLRIEFYPVTAPPQGQARDPINAVTLVVTNTPTPTYLQPVVPDLGSETVIAVLYAIDAPVYVDIGPTPDVNVNRTLINKGTQISVNCASGDNITAMSALDIPQQGDSSIGPITGVINANFDTDLPLGRMFGITCTVAGIVSLLMIDGSVFNLSVFKGFQAYPLSVKRIVSANTTATATYVVML